MRMVLGAVVGLLLGAFVGLDLVLLGVVGLDTIWVFVLAVVGLVLGVLLGRRGARRRAARAT